MSVRFSAAGGKGREAFPNGFYGPGEPGTIFLSEADILRTIEAKVPNDNSPDIDADIDELLK